MNKDYMQTIVRFKMTLTRDIIDHLPLVSSAQVTKLETQLHSYFQEYFNQSGPEPSAAPPRDPHKVHNIPVE